MFKMNNYKTKSRTARSNENTHYYLYGNCKSDLKINRNSFDGKNKFEI